MGTPTHAGGVVYRRRSNTVELLFVRARDAPDLWVIPKGHIEAGELDEQAALREVGEEAGVAAQIEARIGCDEFEGSRGPVRAVYFLMRYEGETPSEEGRERIWAATDEAESLVRFEGAQGVVREAIRILYEGAEG
jgi:8-oxo-dGTP pyrophosphatase MutT (NUDIX family)